MKYVEQLILKKYVLYVQDNDEDEDYFNDDRSNVDEPVLTTIDILKTDNTDATEYDKDSGSSNELIKK